MSIENHSKPLYKEILYTEAEVDARITGMAKDITDRYDPSGTIFVGLPNGVLPFAAKLMSAICRQSEIFQPNFQTMIVSRYGDSLKPGQPRLVADLPREYRNLVGKSIVLLDDLIDRGDTLKFAEEHLMGYGAESVDKVVLVKKIVDPDPGGDVVYGFEAPDAWLTGMGMDDPRLGVEANRWAGWIAIAND